MTTHTETMWAIAGKDSETGEHKLYLPLTRTDAISDHCESRYSGWGDYVLCRRRTWACDRYAGDRAVKVTITYEYPDNEGKGETG